MSWPARWPRRSRRWRNDRCPALARGVVSQVKRGVKRRCLSCEAVFYDMLRFPIHCPKCGAEFDATAKAKLVSVPRPAKSRTARSNFSRSTKPAPDQVAADTEGEARDKAEDAEDREVETGDADETEEAETDDAADPAADGDDDELAEDR